MNWFRTILDGVAKKQVMNWYDGIVIDRLWVGHSRFWRENERKQREKEAPPLGPGSVRSDTGKYRRFPFNALRKRHFDRTNREPHMNHIPIDENPYKSPVRKWLADRYGTKAVYEDEKTVLFTGEGRFLRRFL